MHFKVPQEVDMYIMYGVCVHCARAVKAPCVFMARTTARHHVYLWPELQHSLYSIVKAPCVFIYGQNYSIVCQGTMCIYGQNYSIVCQGTMCIYGQNYSIVCQGTMCIYGQNYSIVCQGTMCIYGQNYSIVCQGTMCYLWPELQHSLQKANNNVITEHTFS